MRSCALAAFRSPSICTASARKFSSWCARRARCIGFPIARNGLRASFFDRVDRADSEYDTEEFYFELLRDIGRTIELRVVVDIIAGASAGGIVGTMLARALSHDLRMETMRDLWLDNADVTVLLSPDTRAGAWSKWFLKPFLWGAAKTGMLGAIRDMEVRQKLSLFVRSRWFRPPLDGRIMAGLMYDAVTSMGEPAQPTQSLLPSGHTLDLFVSLTDFYGYHQLVQIHDPPLIHERDHSHVLQFTYRRRSDGTVESDFDLDNAPALAFAARATSSFPGAFPADAHRRDGRGDRVARGDLAAARGIHRQIVRASSARRCRSGGHALHRRRGAQQPAVPARDLGDPRPAGLPAGRPPPGLYRAASGAAGDAVAPEDAGLLRHAARRHVGHSERAAGDQRTQLGGRVQRPRAAAACDQ